MFLCDSGRWHTRCTLGSSRFPRNVTSLSLNCSRKLVCVPAPFQSEWTFTSAASRSSTCVGTFESKLRWQSVNRSHLCTNLSDIRVFSVLTAKVWCSLCHICSLAGWGCTDTLSCRVDLWVRNGDFGGGYGCSPPRGHELGEAGVCVWIVCCKEQGCKEIADYRILLWMLS